MHHGCEWTLEKEIAYCLFDIKALPDQQWLFARKFLDNKLSQIWINLILQENVVCKMLNLLFLKLKYWFLEQMEIFVYVSQLFQHDKGKQWCTHGQNIFGKIPVWAALMLIMQAQTEQIQETKNICDALRT